MWRSLPGRFYIGRICLAAFDIGLHVGGRDQSHLVPKRRQLARPMMGRGTRFNANQAARHRAEKLHDLRPPKPSSQHHCSFNIDTVNLENLLRQVETDRGNLHVGRFLPSVGDNTHHSGTQMPLRGRPHHRVRSAGSFRRRGRDELKDRADGLGLVGDQCFVARWCCRSMKRAKFRRSTALTRVCCGSLAAAAP